MDERIEELLESFRRAGVLWGELEEAIITFCSTFTDNIASMNELMAALAEDDILPPKKTYKRRYVREKPHLYQCDIRQRRNLPYMRRTF